MAKIILRYNRFLTRTFNSNVSNKWSNYVQLRSFSSKQPNTNFKLPQPNEKDEQKLLKLIELNSLNLDAVNAHETLSKVPSKLISDNYELCKQNGISDEIITTYEDILALKELRGKLIILKGVPLDINKTAPLLRLDIFKLKDVVKFMNDEAENRISFFSRLLNVPEHCICNVATKKPFLFKLDLDKAKDNVELLFSYGVTGDEIIRDLWVLRYTTETIQKRIKYAKENNVEKFKTWMIRATLEIFLNYIRIRCDNKQILGDNSLEQYLATKLNCTVDEANYMVSKQPALRTKSMMKMQEMIGFLHAEGFKSSHIRRHPKILLLSVETIKKRLKELEKAGAKLDGLFLLTQNKRQYQYYYNTLVKKNNTRVMQN